MGRSVVCKQLDQVPKCDGRGNTSRLPAEAALQQRSSCARPPAPTFLNASSAKRGWPTRRKSSSARSAGPLICPVRKPLQGRPGQPNQAPRWVRCARDPAASDQAGNQLRCPPFKPQPPPLLPPSAPGNQLRTHLPSGE